jgi:hypothetical protein
MKRFSLLLVLSAGALTGCGGSSGLSEANHKDFVSGCTSTQPAAACECFYKQLTTKQGINSDDKLNSLNDRLKKAEKSGSAADVPAQLRNAILACKSLVSH